MAYEQKDNSGALFKNESKTNQNYPDHSGSIMVNGEEFWIDGWEKTGKQSGKEFISLSLKSKKKNQEKAKEVKAELNKPADDFIDDQIPF